jgi:hypothetical protein
MATSQRTVVGLKWKLVQTRHTLMQQFEVEKNEEWTLVMCQFDVLDSFISLMSFDVCGDDCCWKSSGELKKVPIICHPGRRDIKIKQFPSLMIQWIKSTCAQADNILSVCKTVSLNFSFFGSVWVFYFWERMGIWNIPIWWHRSPFRFFTESRPSVLINVWVTS